MLKAFTSEWIAAPRRLPPSVTVCAIGDVHGCLDELRGMVAYLRSHVVSPDRHTTTVLCGDYIDRGPASLATLAYLRDLRISGADVVKLLGNHDFFLRLVAGDADIDAEFVESWLDDGGESTFEELGLTRDDLYRFGLDELRTRIRTRLGDGIPALLANLSPFHRVANYLFVHAGIDPSMALAAHDLSDLVLIREPFLTGAGWMHDLTVVHGHTIRGHEILPHRIAVDTGAFHTGVLSCAQLEGDRMRWISVTTADDLAAIDFLPSAMAGRLAYDDPLPIDECG